MLPALRDRPDDIPSLVRYFAQKFARRVNKHIETVESERDGRAGWLRTGNRELAEDQRELSRATILKLANSLPAEEPLRKTLLSAPSVCRVLGTAEQIREFSGL